MPGPFSPQKGWPVKYTCILNIIIMDLLSTIVHCICCVAYYTHAPARLPRRAVPDMTAHRDFAARSSPEISLLIKRTKFSTYLVTKIQPKITFLH
jgi:hypothetical protein